MVFRVQAMVSFFRKIILWFFGGPDYDDDTEPPEPGQPPSPSRPGMKYLVRTSPHFDLLQYSVISKWGEVLTRYFIPGCDGEEGWPGSGVSMLSCRVVVYLTNPQIPPKQKSRNSTSRPEPDVQDFKNTKTNTTAPHIQTTPFKNPIICPTVYLFLYVAYIFPHFYALKGWLG